MPPRDFPPCGTAPGFLRAWITAGVRAHVHDVLHGKSRELEGCEKSPSAAIIASQSVKTGAEAREMGDTTPSNGSRAANAIPSPTCATCCLVSRSTPPA